MDHWPKECLESEFLTPFARPLSSFQRFVKSLTCKLSEIEKPFKTYKVHALWAPSINDVKEKSDFDPSYVT